MIIELIGFGLLILTIILIYNKLKNSTNPDPTNPDSTKPDSTKPDSTKPDDNNTCPLEYRPVNGVCNMKNFKFSKNSDGFDCCLPDDKAGDLTKAQKRAFVIEKIAKDTGIIVGVDLVVRKVLPEVLKVTLKAFGKAFETIGRTILERVAGKAMGEFAEKIGIKLTAMAAEVDLGPVGWAMDAVGIISLGLDLWDPEGFNTFSSNKTVNLPLRNKYEFTSYASIKSDGITPPLIFPLQLVSNVSGFTNISNAYQQSFMDYNTDIINQAITKLSDDDMALFYEEAFGSKNITEAQKDQLASKIKTLSNQISSKTTKKDQDKFIYNSMTKKLSSKDKNLVTLYTLGSGFGDQSGISLSPSGAELYNKNTYSDKDNAVLAVYTDTYRYPDTGTPEIKTDTGHMINMKSKKLDKKYTLLSVLKLPKRSCLDAHKGKGKLTVDPKDYGVSWDDDSGMCVYTKKYCDRMGMKYVSSRNVNGESITDCVMYPGQEISELIFGTTLTRDFIIDANALASISKKGLKIAEKFGDEIAKEFGGSIPRTAGKPLKCASGLEEDAALCYKPCKSGYKGVGPVCWKKCPSGFKDTGVACTKTKGKPYGRGSGYFWYPFEKHSKTYRCEHSSQGKKYGGCEKNGLGMYPKCKSGYHNVGCCICSPDCPKGSTDTGAFCQITKKSYGRGVGKPISACTDENYPDKDGALCYPDCNKSDFKSIKSKRQSGVTYKGVGPVCWPEWPPK